MIGISNVCGVVAAMAVAGAVLGPTPVEEGVAAQFTPDEAARIVGQYRVERARCATRDAERIRREIEGLEARVREIKADKSVPPARRNERAGVVLGQIREKRAALQDVVRGRTEPLPKNLLYSGSWEARTTDGRRLEGDDPLELKRGDFGMIDDELGGSLGRFEPGRSPEAPFVLRYTHTVYTVKLEREQINDPHAFNTPSHAPEHRYSHSASKERTRTEYRVLIRGITKPDTRVNPPVYTVLPEFRGEGLFAQPFIVTEYRDALPPERPTVVLEPFDVEAFRARSGAREGSDE